VPNTFLILAPCVPFRRAPRCGFMSSRSVTLMLLAALLLVCSGLAGAALDPTQPPANLSPGNGGAATDNAVAPLVLQAVLKDAHGRRAMIGGQVLRVGDQYAGARVLSIYAQSVLIERQNVRQLLRLAEPVIQPSR